MLYPGTLVPPGTQSKIFTSETRSTAFSKVSPIPLSPIRGSWRGRLQELFESSTEIRGSPKPISFLRDYDRQISQILLHLFEFVGQTVFKLCFVTRFPILRIIGCFVLMFIGFASVCFFYSPIFMFSSLIVLFFWFLLSLSSVGYLV